MVLTHKLAHYESVAILQSVHYFLDNLYVSSDSLIGSRHAAQIQIVQVIT